MRLVITCILSILFIFALTRAAQNQASNGDGGQDNLILRHFPIDRTISFQGLLKDASGNPVPDASYNITFRIYNRASGGSVLWSSSVIPVATTNGTFNSQLGPISLPFDTTYYLSLQVQSDPEMATRQKLTSSPYSATSDTANYAFRADTSLSALSVADNSISSSKIINGAVIAGKIASGAIDSSKLANNSISSGKITDGAVNNAKIASNSIDSSKIANGGISFSDVNQNGASNGQLMKWNGSAWAAANDETGGPSGWTENNNFVVLTSNSDSVGIGVTNPTAKLDIHGTLKVWNSANIGSGHTLSGLCSSILGGLSNNVIGDYNVNGGGENNTVRGVHSGVFSGFANHAGDFSADSFVFIGGGMQNESMANYGTVGGGRSNIADGVYGGTFSGYGNTGGDSEGDSCAFVGGGLGNSANGPFSVVSGGRQNAALIDYATVAGGDSNSAYWQCTVGGGRRNYAGVAFSTVAGGDSNIANQQSTTIGGGENNTILGSASTISGGVGNYILAATCAIPGGTNDTIGTSGSNSLLFGYGVYCNSVRYVVFYDGLNHGQLSINRDGRDGLLPYPLAVGTNTGNGNGAYLTTGGVWTGGSSRTFKENFQPLDGNELISKIANLSITSYNYKGTTEKHIGPVAEDFVGAFDTGVIRQSDGKRHDMYLAPSDEAGVALAGVQELIIENNQLKKDNETLKIKMDDLEKRLIDLENKR